MIEFVTKKKSEESKINVTRNISLEEKKEENKTDVSAYTSAEQVLNASTGEKIVRVEIINDGHAIKEYSIPELEDKVVEKNLSDVQVKLQVTENNFEEMFPVVEVDKISLGDEFMKYDPKGVHQNRVKNAIIEAKKIRFGNFRRPAIDPSLSDDGKNIVYEKGKKPALGKTAIWWENILKNFMPSKNSMMGTQMHYDVFLGTLIKYLVEEEGYKVSDAWEAVCNCSEDLGHFWNSKDTKGRLEVTGSRQVGKWYDLANTTKLIAHTNAFGFSIVSSYYSYKYGYSLATVGSIFTPYYGDNNAVGWLVLSV